MNAIQTSRSFLTATLMVVAGAALSAATAQTPAPSPSTGPGDYSITSSVEFGVRGLDVNGDHEKYRSDLNYEPGFRLFDSSVLIEDKRSRFRAFDSALFQMSGWGSDPTGSFRMNTDKLGIYKFDSSVRKVQYYNNLKNHAPFAINPVSTGSARQANTLHHFGDFDLTIFPERALRFKIGYGFNDTDGPGISPLRFNRDAFAVDSRLRTRSDDFRAGIEGEFLGFNLGLLYGNRRFKDKTELFEDVFNPGNDLGATTSSLNFASRRYNVIGSTNFLNFYFQRTFAQRVDLTGRLVHSQTDSEIGELDFLTGRGAGAGSNVGNTIVSDEINVPAFARRPQTRGDLGATFRITDKFRISNTFLFDQFNIGGSNTLFELVRARTPAGAAVADAFTNTSSWRATSYRRFSNLVEADYQVNRRFGFNIGYRFTDREVAIGARDRNLVNNTATYTHDEDHKNTTNSIIAGASFKPTNNWTVWVDLERGEADTVFTRLANSDFFNFRVRTRAVIKQFTLSFAGITKDNDNPGVSSEIRSGTGALLFPATETVANSKQRIFSGTVDYSPGSMVDFSGGYTYTHISTGVDVIVPVGTPVFTSTQFLLGRSEFYVRENHFYFDVNVRPHHRLAFYVAYRYNDDNGQGNRVITRAQDMIHSTPFTTHNPEAKVTWRITRNIDWNIAYQYNEYRDREYRHPFAVPQVIIPAQNYTAHMPYTSLRIYFGREAEDR
jgi:hypothetical protein